MTKNLFTSGSLKNDSRIEVVDSLRGFALLGVLIANLPVAETSTLSLPSDEPLGIFYYLFIGKKFMTIFSILFGFGFYIQQKRAKEKGGDFNTYYLKRMALLFLIGTIHAWVFWNGDILRAYAIGGMILLLFQSFSTKKLVATGLSLVIIGSGVSFILPGVLGLSHNYDYAILQEINTTGSILRYLEINFITDPWINFHIDMPLTMFFAVGNMMLGMALGKTGYFELSDKTRSLRTTSIVLGPTLGILASYGFYLVFTGQMNIDIPQLWMPFAIIAGMLAQSLFYMTVFTWMYNKFGYWFLKIFKPIGQMALTNYLAQSLLFVFVFYPASNGASLLGEFGLTLTYGVGLIFFLLQILFSQIWLSNRAQGPVEYLWRKVANRSGKVSSPVLATSNQSKS